MKSLAKFSLFTLLVVMLLFAGNVFANSISISGSSTVQSVAEDIRDQYEKRHDREVSIRGGGSSTGVRDAMEGNSDMGMASREISSEERVVLEWVTVGFDAVVFVVNEDNPVDNISREQARQIFQGNIGNWNDLDGVNDYDWDIVLVSKEIGRSTLDIFEDYSGLTSHERDEGGTQNLISPDAAIIGPNLESIALVGGIPGGIAYVSVGAAQRYKDMGMPIKLTSVDNTEASVANITGGNYVMNRELNYIYLSENEEKVLDFINVHFSGEGAEIIESNGFIPAGRGQN